MSLFQRKSPSHNGDIILGSLMKNNSTVVNKSVVLPAENRYGNTLILGSAGCGKTRHTLIPMIKQDMFMNPSAGITLLEPYGDLSKEIYEIAIAHSYNTEDKKIIQYFNPILDDCPYFNPMEGREDDVVEIICNAFLLLNKEWSQFMQNTVAIAIRNAVKIAKRLYGDNATIMDVNNILENKDNIGLNQYIKVFQNKERNADGILFSPSIQKENIEIVNWFIYDYYSGMSTENKSSKTYENLSELRFQLSKFSQNKYLSKVLNPPREGSDEYSKYLAEKQNYKNTCFVQKINFNEALKDGHITILTTANNNLRDLGKLLGYMMMFHLQIAIVSRDGNSDTRTPNMLYIDDFPQFANANFTEIIRISPSSKVAIHISAISIEMIRVSLGEHNADLKDCILHYSQNKIVYTGVSAADADYFSKLCGDESLFDEFRDFNEKILYYISYSHKKAAYTAVKTKVLEQK